MKLQRYKQMLWFFITGLKTLHGIRAIRLTSIRFYGLKKLFFYSLLQHHGSHGYHQAILHQLSPLAQSSSSFAAMPKTLWIC